MSTLIDFGAEYFDVNNPCGDYTSRINNMEEVKVNMFFDSNSIRYRGSYRLVPSDGYKLFVIRDEVFDYSFGIFVGRDRIISVCDANCLVNVVTNICGIDLDDPEFIFDTKDSKIFRQFKFNDLEQPHLIFKLDTSYAIMDCYLNPIFYCPIPFVDAHVISMFGGLYKIGIISYINSTFGVFKDCIIDREHYLGSYSSYMYNSIDEKIVFDSYDKKYLYSFHKMVELE